MRILPALLLAPLLWLAGLALAAEGDLQPIPALRAPVTDVAGVLAPADLDALNRKLLAFSEQQGSQVVVLIVPTTAPENIFDYTFRVAEAWKPGRKGVDDGVVLMLAINDRKSHMQVGYGLEGAIPDIRAKQILQDIMPPYLRRGDYAGGIDAGTDAVIKLIKGENLPLPEPQQVRGGGGDSGSAIFFAIIAGLVASAFFRVILGRLLGGLAGGAVAFGLALALGLAVGLAVMAAFFAMLAAGGRGGFIPGGFGGGGFGRGGFGGGGFGGGGGSFGGGGASGDW
jgi:uncharacterized protein